MVLSSASPLDISDRQQLLACWFADYQAPLLRYLVWLVGDEERAADLLQDTFVQAFTALSAQAPPVHVHAWLHRIATNLAYNALRRRQRWRWIPLTGQEQAPAFEGGLATAQSVRRCLTRLRPKELEALLLYEWAGFTCVEIAAVSHETPNAVRLRLSRARARFCALYAKEIAHGVS